MITYSHCDYACFDYEYAIREFFRKHQALLILKTTDINQNAIIEYYGTYYETARG